MNRSTDIARLVAPLAAVLSLAASGCFVSTSDSCQIDSDCYQGEVCRAGTCVAVGSADGGGADATDVEAGEDALDAATDAVEDTSDVSPDTGSVSCELKQRAGCPCNYDGNDAGVCAGLERVEGGMCPKPDDWESSTDAEKNCDGKDNDCDGHTDEGCDCTYQHESNAGVCKNATRNTKGKCQKPSLFEPDETSCDEKDNDCDGTADEDCECVPSKTDKRECFGADPSKKNEGQCEPGTQPCKQDGTWGMCKNQVLPDSETCNGKDDDCDGKKDEEWPKLSSSCDGGDADQCADGAWVCGPNGNEAVCSGDDKSPKTEKCSPTGMDEDCDGVTDEGCPCNYNGKSEGVCRQKRDTRGNCPKPPSYVSPVDTELACNDKDD
ncbi:MAG: MopE-related protein, partial [Bradymonadaceae bacterium]